MSDDEQLQESARISQEIYNEWKWKMKSQCRTYGEVADTILDAITRVRNEIKHPDVRNAVIDQLNKSLARVSEFTVDDDVNYDLIFGRTSGEVDSASPIETQGCCCMCKRVIAAFEEKFPYPLPPVGNVQRVEIHPRFICVDCHIAREQA